MESKFDPWIKTLEVTRKDYFGQKLDLLPEELVREKHADSIHEDTLDEFGAEWTLKELMDEDDVEDRSEEASDLALEVLTNSAIASEGATTKLDPFGGASEGSGVPQKAKSAADNERGESPLGKKRRLEGPQ